MAFIVLLLLLAASGCSGEKARNTATPGPTSKQGPTSQPGPTPQSGSTAGKDEKPLRALLLTAGVPGHMQIGVGDMVWDSRQKYIAVDLAEPGISPNLWVVSPFFEPMKFAPTLTGTSYQPAKVDLAALAKEIPPRPLPVSPTSRGYQVGPFPIYGPALARAG